MQLDRLGYLYVQIIQISHSETFQAYLHCKEIKVPSLIAERLSGAFHLQPIKFPVAFSSVRRGSGGQARVTDDCLLQVFQGNGGAVENQQGRFRR